MILTKRELEVLHCLVIRLSNKEIADALDITEGTVKIHVHHILSKLDVGSRVEAIDTARRRRLLGAETNLRGRAARSTLTARQSIPAADGKSTPARRNSSSA